MHTTRQAFTTQDVVRLTGASYRRIDYWCRTTPCFFDQSDLGSGRRRRWTADDITRIDLMRRITDAGVDLELARSLVCDTPVGEPITLRLQPGVVVMVEWRSVAEMVADLDGSD